ncbi:MAG: Xaa-Pro peptidase family protein [Syntrophales bacterium]|jgi:Xaa-Pro aminopeptidase|nr:Xaa-Pro peptidase family protein [Syntrophales bacterium]
MSQRIEPLQAVMMENGFDALILIQSRDILYYTGTAQPSWFVVLPGAHRLFVRRGLDRALSESSLDPSCVELQPKREGVFSFLRKQGLPKRPVFGTELDVLPVGLWNAWKAETPDWEYRDISPYVLRQRQIKDQNEITSIRNACRIEDEGHRRALGILAEGVSELDVAAAVEDAHRCAGHEGIFFMRQPDFFMSRGLFASGPNLFQVSGVASSLTGVGPGPAVPAGPSKRLLCRGDLVMIDIPVLHEGYHVDQARTYRIGPAPHRVREMQRILECLFEYAGGILRPEQTWSDAFRRVSAFADRLGAAHSFQRMPDGSRLHYIGHGVGLELNEPPMITERNSEPILPGTVIALEMHLLDGDVVLKMEDMLLIGEAANEVLSVTPRQLFEIL